MDNHSASRGLLTSARQLIDGSRQMLAWSIARIIANHPVLSLADVRRLAPADVLLKLLDSPCDLDVLIFAQRHPRALLTVDDIAHAVGRDANAVRISIETLTVSGLLACAKMRRQRDDGDVLFYEFTPGTWHVILPALCWVTASADGRRGLRRALLRRRIRSGAVAGELQ